MKLNFFLITFFALLVCVCCVRNRDKNKNELDELETDQSTNDSCRRGRPGKNGRPGLRGPPGPPGHPGECKRVCEVTRKATTLTTTITVTEAITPTSTADFKMYIPITPTASVKSYDTLTMDEGINANINEPTPQIIDKKIPSEDNPIFEIVKEKVDNILSSSDPKNDRKETKPITNDQPILYGSRS